jgi:type I restriction enzyme M protein
MAKNNNKTDINFENELWKAANELRGAVAENQCKNYSYFISRPIKAYV